MYVRGFGARRLHQLQVVVVWRYLPDKPWRDGVPHADVDAIGAKPG